MISHNRIYLLDIWTTLYHDFVSKSVNTLSKIYALTMWHINILGLATKPSQKIHKDFCLTAAEALKPSVVGNMNLPMIMRK